MKREVRKQELRNDPLSEWSFLADKNNRYEASWERKKLAEQDSNGEDLMLVASVAAAAACDSNKSSRDAVYETENSIGSSYDSSSSSSSSFDSGSSSGAGSF